MRRGDADSTQEATRVALNKLILSDASLYDFIVRPDVVLVNTADRSAFLSNGVHLTTAGNKEVARLFASAVIGVAPMPAAPLDALAYNGLQVNGSCDISQELGTAGASLASAANKYTADMWEGIYVHGAGTAVLTSGQTAVGSLPGFAFGHRITASTALSGTANDDFALHRTRIEGYRARRLGWGTAGAQPLSIGFWFYATKSGTTFAKIQNSDSSRCFYKEFTVTAGSWKWVEMTIPGDTQGTWQSTTGAGIIINVFASGKTGSPVSPDVWSGASSVQTTNSENLLDADASMTIVTGLIVLPGIELPSSERAALILRPWDQELLLCKRYWQSTYEYGVAPGTSTTTGARALVVQATNSFADMGMWQLSPEMRVAPTMTAYSSTGASGKIRDATAGADLDAIVGNVSTKGARAIVNSTSTAAGNGLQVHLVADARL